MRPYLLKFADFFPSFVLTILFPLVWTACSEDENPKDAPCSQAFSITVLEQKPSECGRATGTLKLASTGGSGAVLFRLAPKDYQNDGTFTGLAAGSYTVFAKDEKGCETSLEVSMSDQTDLSLTSEVLASAGCGEEEGSIRLSASGGAGGYQFAIDQGEFSESTLFEGLVEGNHTIKVKDANGCIITESTQLSSGIRFSKDIVTIISTNCAVTACHVTGAQFPDFSVKDNILKKAERIRSRTSAKTMPPTSSSRRLKEEEIQKIACWVKDGALDN